MDPDFSVIIPTFGRPRELVEAIASALGQREVSVEVLVVDDSSEGSAEVVVRGFQDPRVIYLKNPTPTGGFPSIVRNIGWPLARGRFIHFLDDDDIVVEGHYAAAIAVFAADPSIGLVFGRIEPFAQRPSEQLELERQYFGEAARKAALSRRFGSRLAFVGRMLFGNALLVCSSSVIRRKCVETIGGFDPSIRLMEDADFHVRAMRACGARFLERTAIRYRIGSPSLMHSPNPTAEQRKSELLGRRQMQASYRRRYGSMEFYALALFARTILLFF
ncbi:GT2 family glycosyltransferase [Bradyrhizobium sp. F1.4.3]|uniref:glycosyltransferase family 2 protein n=1 Tax=Bradyrhizobium sp. F1.4.3 TaxID=3156356 RepID=UPI00339B9BAF